MKIKRSIFSVLGKKRWKGVSRADRVKQMKALADKRWKKP